MARRGKRFRISPLLIQGISFFLLPIRHVDVSNHSVIVAVSLTDFLSTDFTCPSISHPGQEAEAQGQRPWCSGASASMASGAVALPLLLPAGCSLSLPCGSEADWQSWCTGQTHPGELPWSGAALFCIPRGLLAALTPAACSGGCSQPHERSPPASAPAVRGGAPSHTSASMAVTL